MHPPTTYFWPKFQQIQEINIVLNESINNDVDLIETVIDRQIKPAYKATFDDIKYYLLTIEDYLMRFVQAKQQPSEEDVTKLKIIKNFMKNWA